MSSDSIIQMYPISSTTSIPADNNVLNNNQNSNSSGSIIGRKANVSFVSDCPITDPGQAGKVSSQRKIHEIMI